MNKYIKIRPEIRWAEYAVNGTIRCEVEVSNLDKIKDVVEVFKRKSNYHNIGYVYHTKYNVIEDYKTGECVVIEPSESGDIYDVMSVQIRKYCRVR